MSTSLQIQVRKPRGFKKRYEFYAGGKELAVLDYEKAYSKKATASNGDRKWKFTKIGFWKPFIEITAEQSPYTKTKLQHSWNCKLQFKADNGDEYLLKKTSHWKNTWAWVDEKNNPVIQMKSNQFSKSNRGNINILHYQAINKDLLFLMLIGWYRLIASEAGRNS